MWKIRAKSDYSKLKKRGGEGGKKPYENIKRHSSTEAFTRKTGRASLYKAIYSTATKNEREEEKKGCKVF